MFEAYAKRRFEGMDKRAWLNLAAFAALPVFNAGKGFLQRNRGIMLDPKTLEATQQARGMRYGTKDWLGKTFDWMDDPIGTWNSRKRWKGLLNSAQDTLQHSPQVQKQVSGHQPDYLSAVRR